MAIKVAWIGDVPALMTGFATTARTVLSYLASEGFQVACFSVSSPFDINYSYRVLKDDKPVDISFPMLILNGRDESLNSFDAVIGHWNPKYISQASAIYDQVWTKIKTRKIGYFVHEDRYMPHRQGEFFYNYKGDYELVLTTPAQDIWGYAKAYPDKVNFIPHALDLDAIRERLKSHEGAERKYITAVMANNNVRKRWDILLKSMPEIEWGDYRLVTPNPDGLYKLMDMIDWVSSTGKHVNIRLGASSDIWEVYSQTKLLVNPTTGEAFSYPIAEALAAGAPVVATDLPELHELYGGAITYVRSHPILQLDGPLQLEPDQKDFVKKVNLALKSASPHPEAVSKFDVKKIGKRWADLLTNDRNA